MNSGRAGSAGRRMLAAVATSAEDFSGAVAGITTLLVTGGDGAAVLRAVAAACVAALSADGVGVLVSDPRGGSEVLAVSDERARLAGLFQAHTAEGPAADCVATNAIVGCPDLGDAEGRWPRFAAAAQALGLRAVHGFPLRLSGRAVGSLNVLHARPTELSGSLLHAGEALADFAVLGLTQEQDPRRVERLAERTLATLNDRAHLNQAVGLLAGTSGRHPDDVRARLSAYSVRTGRSLRDLAHAITDGDLTAAAVLDPIG
jgi:GAF domain-containing protein